MKTWHIEMFVIAIVLLLVNAFAKTLLSIELLASIAVLLSFGHTQISARLIEKEEARDLPDVSCYKKLWYYFMAKEFFWILYFLMNKSYSALVGCFVFLAYPIWRNLYIKYKLVKTDDKV